MSGELAVIIPTCNRPELLERAIRSALAQPVDVTVVVVNDGPNPLPPDDKVIQVRTPRPSSGPSVARNVGLDACPSSIKAVCYLDDDDELLPNYAETQLELLKEKDFGFSTAVYQYEDGTQIVDPEPENDGLKRYYDPGALMEQNVAPVSCFVHVRGLAEKIGGWDESLLRMEDWDFWGRMGIVSGEPSWTPRITNVIHKGISLGRSDHNIYAYSMSCHWRDIVADRLKVLSERNRGRLEPGDPVPTVPPLTLVLHGRQNWALMRNAVTDHACEVVFVHDHPVDAPGFRQFPAPQDAPTDVHRINYGFLLSRSKYVWFGNVFVPPYFSAIKSDASCDLVYGRDGILCKRAVIERLGGLKQGLLEDEAFAVFLSEAREHFDVREMG